MDNNIKEALSLVYSVKLTPEELRSIKAQLTEPFDEEDIKWKPQSVSKKDPNNAKGQAAAFASPRAYVDRLNEVVGPHGWFQLLASGFSYPSPKKVSKWGDAEEKYVDTAKIVTTCSVGILGLGFKTDIGESWMDDENAATIAAAQAFKRACYNFGLGRYLYDLPQVWYPIDKYGKWKGDGPALPEWAKPRKLCQDCGNQIVAIELQVKGELKKFGVVRLIENSMLKYDGKKLCHSCQVKRRDAKKDASGNRVGAAPNAGKAAPTIQ